MFVRFLLNPALFGAFLFNQKMRFLIVDFLIREFVLTVFVLTALVFVIPFWRVIAGIH
jgi:hypothetical protein